MDQEYHIPAAVVRKASQGDETAREMLYQQYAQKMYSICVRMTGNRTDAEDLLQEAFILAFSKIHQLKETGLFEPWLRKIVVNECIRFTKRSFGKQHFSEELPDIAEEVTTGWMDGIEFEQIHKEIRNLPDGCREIFNLYVVEDYSHGEIARELNISESTSKSQYHRARQLLKERLLKQFVQHG